jgi:hypothetical protein
MEIEIENNEAITTLNTPDDLGIYSNSYENNIENLSSLDENFYGFVNPYIDDIKKVQSEITEVKSQISDLEKQLPYTSNKTFYEINISLLKEKLNELTNKLNSFLLLLQKNVYKRVPVSSTRSSIPLENQIKELSDDEIKKASSLSESFKDEIKKDKIKDNEVYSKKEELNEDEISSNKSEDNKIFGFTKVGFGIGLSVVLLAAGFITYKIIKK